MFARGRPPSRPRHRESVVPIPEQGFGRCPGRAASAVDAPLIVPKETGQRVAVQGQGVVVRVTGVAPPESISVRRTTLRSPSAVRSSAVVGIRSTFSFSPSLLQDDVNAPGLAALDMQKHQPLASRPMQRRPQDGPENGVDDLEQEGRWRLVLDCGTLRHTHHISVHPLGSDEQGPTRESQREASCGHEARVGPDAGPPRAAVQRPAGPIDDQRHSFGPGDAVRRDLVGTDRAAAYAVSIISDRVDLSESEGAIMSTKETGAEGQARARAVTGRVTKIGKVHVRMSSPAQINTADLATVLAGDHVILSRGAERVELPVDMVNALRRYAHELGRGGKPRLVAITGDRATLSSQEAADILNVSRPFVVKLARAGQLRHTKTGNRHRFALTDILEYDARARGDRDRALREVVPADGYDETDF